MIRADTAEISSAARAMYERDRAANPHPKLTELTDDQVRRLLDIAIENPPPYTEDDKHCPLEVAPVKFGQGEYEREYTPVVMTRREKWMLLIVVALLLAGVILAIGGRVPWANK